jgi:hypothetical protein
MIHFDVIAKSHVCMHTSSRCVHILLHQCRIYTVCTHIKNMHVLLCMQGIGKAIGTDADSRDGREMKMCSSFANSGPLPLLFVDRYISRQYTL